VTGPSSALYAKCARAALTAVPRVYEAGGPRQVGMDALIDINDEILQPPWGQIGRSFTLGLVSLGTKCVLQVMNTFTVANHDTFLDAVLHRTDGVGLLTVSNHTRCFSRYAQHLACILDCLPRPPLAATPSGSHSLRFRFTARSTTRPCSALCCPGSSSTRRCSIIATGGPCALRTYASEMTCSGAHNRGSLHATVVVR
jgi:hypothetical protein